MTTPSPGDGTPCPIGAPFSDPTCVKNVVVVTEPKGPVYDEPFLPFTGFPVLGEYGVGLILFGLGLMLKDWACRHAKRRPTH